MEDVSSDPYEQKLYQMFKSHDVESNGCLNKSALEKLCKILELKEREPILIACLMENNSNGFVTFKKFKEGLLTLLGTDLDDSTNDDYVQNYDTNLDNGNNKQHQKCKTSLKLTQTITTTSTTPAVAATTTTLAGELNSLSPSREVSPKFVVAGKKYGRRSRPPSAVFDSSGSDDSGDENNFTNENTATTNSHLNNNMTTTLTGAASSKSQSQSQKVQRSSSQSDMNYGSTRKRHTTSGSKLKRCASLPSQPKPKKEEKSQMLNTQRESSVESLGNLDFENLSHSLYDVWNEYGHNTGNFLNKFQLERVCERVGLHGKIACKVANEVFEKLGFEPINNNTEQQQQQRISFSDFIALIQSCSSSEMTNDEQQTPMSSSSTSSQATQSHKSKIHTDDNDDEEENNLSYTISSTTRHHQTPLQTNYSGGNGVNSGGNHLHFNKLTNTSGIPSISASILLSSSSSSSSSAAGGGVVTTIGNKNATSMSELDLHVNSEQWPKESSAVPFEVIADMWDAAGISNSRVILDNLGFGSKEIHISQLSLAIDDDLQSLSGNDETKASTLLRASLTLHKAEVNALQQAFRQLATQNQKLQANNRDINRRAALLAQEVDERHAHLESSARTEICQLEQRHMEIVRDITNQLANDREHWSQTSQNQEKRIKSLESDEQILRHEHQIVQQENSALETEVVGLQKQITDLLEENIKLNNEIVAVGDGYRGEDNTRDDNEEMLELIEKISTLQLENANLRDKNDELVSELEEKICQVQKLKSTTKKLTRAIESNSSTASLLAVTTGLIDSDGELTQAAATKRRGDSPSKAKISEESPKLGKMRKCSNATAELDANDSETSGDWVALNQELSQSSSATGTTNTATMEDSSKEKPESGKEFAELKERNQELELSLEQMRKEFEDLEDYWQSKLTEERQLYETEQQKSNDKFDELLKKMNEYENQFLSGLDKDGRLSPIEEKYQLEQQYTELEAETEEIKSQARELLEQKSQEIIGLQEKLKKYQHQIIADKSNEQNNTSAALSGCGGGGGGSTVSPQIRLSDIDSPASSPISYLWQQSTIQAPTRDYHNPNWNSRQLNDETDNNSTEIKQKLSYTELNDDIASQSSYLATISPIQRPQTPQTSCSNKSDNFQPNRNDDSPIPASPVNSYGTHSVALTHSVHKSFPDTLLSDSGGSEISLNQLRDDIKRLKIFELRLKDTIQEMSQHRDSLMMELQQLQEAKPVWEKAYARASHPSLMQRITQLEQKNRTLEQHIRNQQQYMQQVMQQSWQQQRTEVNELHHRLETHSIIIAEQAQRLTNADTLAKDLFVENSNLNAAVHRLEQQRIRSGLMLQGMTSVPGMPSI